MKKAKIYDGLVICPHCGYKQEADPGEISCEHCFEKFEAVEEDSKNAAA